MKIRMYLWGMMASALLPIHAIAVPGVCDLIDCYPDESPPEREPSLEEACNAAAPATKTFEATLEYVVDGDTLRINHQGRSYPLRIASIDTPEIHYQGKSQGFWGEEADRNMKSLIQRGDVVRVELSPKHCDKHGRLTGSVFAQGRDVGQEQIRKGLAVLFCIQPNLDHCAEYALETKTAQKGKTGFWAESNFSLPYNWRRIVSGRPHEKYIGNLFSLNVFAPGALSKVPIAERVFFMNREDVVTPFRWADR